MSTIRSYNFNNIPIDSAKLRFKLGELIRDKQMALVRLIEQEINKEFKDNTSWADLNGQLKGISEVYDLLEDIKIEELRW